MLLLFFNSALANEFDYRFSYDGFFSFESYQHEDSIINPYNEILQLPDYKLIFDQRPDLKLLINDGKIIIRPYLSYTQQKYKTTLTNKNETQTETKVNLSDFFYEQILNQKMFFTIGLQSYSWGPAELLNPSNPFFHFSSEQRSFGFKEKGQILARINWNTTKEHSFVAIVEPLSNLEKNWIYKEEFKEQFVFKFEKEFKNSRHLFGLVAGVPNDADYFIGQYGQYEFFDGATIYFDSKQSKNKIYIKPELINQLYRLNKVKADVDLSQLTIFGLRYEDSFDIRLEYVYNSLGYSESEFNDAIISMRQISIYQSDNLKSYQNTGLELISKNYLYFSVRKSDFLQFKDLNFFIRSLNSIMDYSAVDQIELDKTFGDHTTVFGQIAIFRGNADSEFKLANDYKGTFGLKVSY